MTDSKAERYEVDGYEVVFRPWYSESMEEDFTAVYVLKDGGEMLHAGMTKLVPSEEQARDVVRDMLALRKVAE